MFSNNLATNTSSVHVCILCILRHANGMNNDAASSTVSLLLHGLHDILKRGNVHG